MIIAASVYINFWSSFSVDFEYAGMNFGELEIFGKSGYRDWGTELVIEALWFIALDRYTQIVYTISNPF